MFLELAIIILRTANLRIKDKRDFIFMQSQEVSRVRSTGRKPFQRNLKLKAPIGKEQIRRKLLPPYYVTGFIDGEGSFSISIGKNTEYRRGVQIRPEFEIELRADDREVLERIVVTLGCGKIYDCAYDRYGWYPHVKYKITGARDMEKFLFPFLDKYPPQAKKAKVYKLFRKIVMMYLKKEHLTDKGFKEIVKTRDIIRSLGKKHYSAETARVRENRSPGGVGQEVTF